MAEQDKQARLYTGLAMILNMSIEGVRGVFLRTLPAIPRAARDHLLARQNAIIAQRLLGQMPDIAMSIPTPRPPRITGTSAIAPAIVAARPQESPRE